MVKRKAKQIRGVAVYVPTLKVTIEIDPIRGGLDPSPSPDRTLQLVLLQCERTVEDGCQINPYCIPCLCVCVPSQCKGKGMACQLLCVRAITLQREGNVMSAVCVHAVTLQSQLKIAVTREVLLEVRLSVVTSSVQ
jgi:hypothetical protein